MRRVIEATDALSNPSAYDEVVCIFYTDKKLGFAKMRGAKSTRVLFSAKRRRALEFTPNSFSSRRRAPALFAQLSLPLPSLLRAPRRECEEESEHTHT